VEHFLAYNPHAIAGAVALAVIHDFRKNASGILGFPQISIPPYKNNTYNITLSWTDTKGNTAEVTFQLSKEIASSAANLFKLKSTYDPVIFGAVQSALGELEMKVMNSAGN
jgi:hypothetical protein